MKSSFKVNIDETKKINDCSNDKNFVDLGNGADRLTKFNIDKQ